MKRLPGHREAGMELTVDVGEREADA